jgi:mRNA interferase RelE/StbE
VASYRVEIKLSAIRELEAIEQKGSRQRVARRIRALGTEPRPPGCQKLAGGEGRYRVRQGRYRIVYSVDDAERLVTVFRIGDRKEVYR